MADGNAHPSLKCECGAIVYGCVPDRPGEVASVRCARCGRGIRFQRTLAGWTSRPLPWKRKRDGGEAAPARPVSPGKPTGRDSH